MARMSIDDKFCRDPRVLHLAKLCRWSRRETMGCMLDIFSLCYDRVSEFLPVAQIVMTVSQDGPDCPEFIDHLITCELASRHKSGMIRIAGAQERIRYLRTQSTNGRQGGLKSAEGRRKQVKRNPSDAQATLEQWSSTRRSDPQAPLNPPDPVPDPASAPVPDLAPDPVPSLSPPPDPPTLRVVSAVDEREEFLRQLLRKTGTKHAMEFAEVKKLIGSTALGPSVVDDHAELRELLWSAPTLIDLEKKCLHVLAVRKAEAIDKRTLQYFGGGMWRKQNVSYALAREVGEHEAARKSTFAVVDAFFDELERKEKT